MYRLIVEIGEKQEVIAGSADRRELELMVEAHIRKGAQGFISIEEVEEEAPTAEDQQ